MKKPRDWLTILGLLAMGPVASPAAGNGGVLAPEPSRPNVLIFLADDLGYADIGVNGCSDFATPNIDSIAHDGIRFTGGYVSAPVCSPSRAGLISGRWQTRFGHEFNHMKADMAPFGLPPSVKTSAQWFQDAGYATAHIGKWHLGMMSKQEFRPERRGFDESVWFPGQDKLPPLRFFKHDGMTPPGNPDHDAGVEHMAKFYFEKDDPKFQEAARTDDLYVDLAMAREAGLFIRKNQSRPWFLYMAFLTPHDPLMTPPGSEDSRIADGKRRKCAAMMTLLDRSIGDVLATLRETGQEDRTLIVFLSDNGAIPSNGSRNTPFRGFKGTLWEGAIREPFLMRWKDGLPAGRVVDEPVSSLDILPTALAAASVDVSPGTALDGVNLLPFLTGKTEEPPHDVLYWRYGDDMAVRSGDWKLVRTWDSDGDHAGQPLPPLRLFNLKKDPGETTDLAASESGKTGALLKKWEDWNAKNVPPLWRYDSVEGTKQTASHPGKTP